MGTARESRGHALECERLAEMAPDVRDTFLAIAARWRSLAEEIDTNTRLWAHPTEPHTSFWRR
jgi:hypothetical protein